MRTALVALLLALVSCNSAEPTPTENGTPPTTTPPVEEVDAAVPDDAAVPPFEAGPAGGVRLRIMAANISSGATLSYGPPEGVRIFQGLKPDVVLVQEFKGSATSVSEVDSFVTGTFGPGFTHYREPGVEIPNGIISRYPILESGRWIDPQVANRGFAYAKIAVPGEHPLWAVSLHLLTSSGSARSAEATALVAQIKTVVPAADYLVVGGDFNTNGRSETCIATLGEVVVTGAPYPADEGANESTNAPRNATYDWLLADIDLAKLHVPAQVGPKSFAAGLVFDSRVYTPLTDVAPVEAGDSAALNMQHMPVVRDFVLP